MYIVYFFGAYTLGFALFYAVGSFKILSDRLM
ncbi:phage coat protein [Salmonella enterica subsp. enterica]|nr:phage coat protein [Salmonella enterica subsp. enterica]RFA82079.1 phage coat protein [Escherichia coli]